MHIFFVMCYTHWICCMSAPGMHATDSRPGMLHAWPNYNRALILGMQQVLWWCNSVIFIQWYLILYEHLIFISIFESKVCIPTTITNTATVAISSGSVNTKLNIVEEHTDCWTQEYVVEFNDYHCHCCTSSGGGDMISNIYHETCYKS